MMTPRCPLCQDSEVVLRYALRQKNIWRCPPCRILFADSVPGEESLKTRYEEAAPEFEFKYFESFKDLRARSFKRGLQTLRDFVKPGLLLDIGTGLGFFLVEAQRSGWEAEGLEGSEKVARHARKVLKLSVRAGSVEEASSGGKRYRVVTLWDVLEHLPDPKGTLCQIRSFLEEKGMVIIRTPIYDSLIPAVLAFFYRVSGGRIRFGLEKIFEEHLFHFSEQGLRLLLGRCGFRAVCAYREDYIDPGALRRKEWARNPFIRWGALLLIAASHILRRQDEVVMYAQPL